MSKHPKGVIYLDDGGTLEDLITAVQEKGVTDLSCVKIQMEYMSGCCGGHPEGEYCYCESGYNDIRVEWPAQ